MIQRSFNNNFFLQKMKVREVTTNREQYFQGLCKGKHVLHVGCTDFPIFNPEHNLHIKISAACKSLDGFDTDIEGMKVLSGYVPGNYFSSIEHVKGEYDLLIVPEVIEHVPDINLFLSELQRINFKEILISGPCLLGHITLGYFNYRSFKGSKQTLLKSSEDYIEEVHPDHKVWFSPYTLANTIETFTPWKIKEVIFLENKHMVGVVASKD